MARLIVHMVRNPLRFVSWKDRKLIATDLKKTYQSITVEEAERGLETFARTWDGQYPSISQSWRNHWPNLIAFFDCPNEIRKVIMYQGRMPCLIRGSLHRFFYTFRGLKPRLLPCATAT